ncbi:MAG: SPOR domain-containing protein [Desulfobacterales bacterium]|jgi:Flp pilus assembly protein TadD
MMRSIKTVLAIIGIALLLMRPAAQAQDEDWHAKGRRLLGQKQYDEAIKAFSNAIDIMPHDFQSYNYRGVAWALKADFDRAIADYSKAIEIRPRYAEAYNNRGFAHTRTGDLKAALNDYTRALEIKPFFVDAYNNKAWILATSSDHRIRDGGQAVRLATKAVELKADISSMDTLAAAHAATGNFEKAVDLQTKAIQKLMEENKTAEVPKYMKHLRSYRSRHALLIDYSAGARTAVTQSIPKASLKAGSKGGAVAPDEKAKITSTTNPPKRAAVKPTGQTPAEQTRPAPSVKSQSAASTVKTPKPAAAPGGKKAAIPVKAASPDSSPKTATVIKTAKSTAAAPQKKSPAPAVKSLPYTIQVSSFRDPQKSMQVARKLNTKGDPAFTSPVNITGKGKWYRVYIGNYGTLAEAKGVAKDLKRRKFRYVNVTRTPYTVQVGEPIPKSKTGELQTQLQAKGYFSYSLPVKTDPNRIRVLVGAFENKQAAANLSTQLKQDGFSPKITLK